jgi:hypothetical protein
MTSYDLTHPDPMGENALAHLRDALNTPNLQEAVGRYYAQDSVFAGNTFDTLGNNPTENKITSDDLLAVSLLDVSWTPVAVRALLVERADEFNELLGKVDGSVKLWDAQGGRKLADAVDPLWKLLMELPGVGPTITSKLLARKRPELIPITDSVIVSAVGTSGRTWATLRYCFQDEGFQKLVGSLRPSETVNVSLLRIFDVAIWMLYSGSTAARKVRADLGIADQP